MFPILFESKFLSIQSLWVFVVIASMVTSFLSIKRLKRKRVNFNILIENSTGIILLSLIFSRILYFLTHMAQYQPAFDLLTIQKFFTIWDEGFSFWGWILCFFTLLSWRLIKAGEEIYKWYDALIVPLIIALIIGNFGAFLGGHAYGMPTELPWGVLYQTYGVKYTVPVHPTQFYAIFLLSLILFSKIQLKKKTEFFQIDGNSTLYLLSLSSIGLLFIEFLRGDDMLTILGIRWHVFPYALVACISSFLLYKRYRINKNNESTTST